jgi:hypothetical protein
MAARWKSSGLVVDIAKTALMTSPLTNSLHRNAVRNS